MRASIFYERSMLPEMKAAAAVAAAADFVIKHAPLTRDARLRNDQRCVRQRQGALNTAHSLGYGGLGYGWGKG